MSSYTLSPLSYMYTNENPQLFHDTYPSDISIVNEGHTPSNLPATLTLPQPTDRGLHQPSSPPPPPTGASSVVAGQTLSPAPGSPACTVTVAAAIGVPSIITPAVIDAIAKDLTLVDGQRKILHTMVQVCHLLIFFH